MIIKDKNENILAFFIFGNDILEGKNFVTKDESQFQLPSFLLNKDEVIEKHFTLDKEMLGPDHSSSLDPQGFFQLVNGVREIEKSMGSFIKKPSKAEKLNIPGMKRSLVYSRSLSKGETLNENHFAYKRPFNGLSPNQLKHFIGKKLRTNVDLDDLVLFEHI